LDLLTKKSEQMKMLKYSFGLMAIALLGLSSCRDSVEPNVPYSTFDNGAYLRTITAPTNSTTFNFFDLGASKFALTLEAVDKEDGATVEKVEVWVRHSRLIAGQGFEYTPASDVLVKTIQASAFEPNTESRFLRTSFEVAAADAIAAVGLTPADMAGGDVFEFRLVLHDKLGRAFSTNNVTTNVAGAPFYASPFQYRVSVVCPSDLAGTYEYSTVNGSAYGTNDALQVNGCPGPVTGSVVLTAVGGSPGAYTLSDASFGVWKCLADPAGVATGIRLNDACETLSFSGQDTYSATYTFKFISNNGTELKFKWSNLYGEEGTVTLFANPGKPWPLGLQ
jgi:hypothetical protein